MDLAALAASYSVMTQHLQLEKVQTALVLGSGWSNIAEAFEIEAELSYEELPVMGAPGVVGHKGRLLLVRVANSKALIFQGRRHWYEGLGWSPVAFPIYAALKAGVQRVILTNAAGGVNPQYIPGDLMVITDHINMLGHNPLVGPHEAIWGPRFPDQSAVYCPRLQTLLKQTARDLGHELREGLYLAASGPMYETPAEIRMFRKMGADAVGMSTVPEAILAHAAGLRVTGLSCITNHAAGVTDAPLGHDEVLSVTEGVMPVMTELLQHVVTRLAEPN